MGLTPDDVVEVLPIRDPRALRAEVAGRVERARRRRRRRVQGIVLPAAAVVVAVVAGGMPGRPTTVRTFDREGRPANGGTVEARGSMEASDGGEPSPSRLSPPGAGPAPAGPALSPAGTGEGAPPRLRLAFVGEAGVYEMLTDGTGLRRLRDPGASDPAWSPDGRWLAYTEHVPLSSRFRVVVLDLGSGAQRTALEFDDASAEYPAWSPDGRFLAVSRRPLVAWDEADPLAQTVWLVDVKDGTASSPGSGSEPAWSPDGRLLVRRGDDWWMMEADGRSTALSNTAGLVGATWSPDGHWIAAVTAQGSRLVVQRTDGSDRRVLADGGAGAGAPAWFPDSSRVAYSMSCWEPCSEGGLWSIALDGTDRRRLTSRNGDRAPALVVDR